MELHAGKQPTWTADESLRWIVWRVASSTIYSRVHESSHHIQQETVRGEKMGTVFLSNTPDNILGAQSRQDLPFSRIAWTHQSCLQQTQTKVRYETKTRRYTEPRGNTFLELVFAGEGYTCRFDKDILPNFERIQRALQYTICHDTLLECNGDERWPMEATSRRYLPGVYEVQWRK